MLRLAASRPAAAGPCTGRRALCAISKSRTDTTAQLWTARRDRLAERERAGEQDAGERPPGDSALAIELPVSSDPALRVQYENYRGTMRLGKLWEDLDACAANVAHLHAHRPGVPQPKMVTAAVDSMTLRRPLAVSHDLRMRGAATWVGRSSMEVTVGVGPVGAEEDHLEATFLMVARSRETGGGAELPRLRAETAEERAREAQGELNKQRRLEEGQVDLSRIPPTADEVGRLHELLVGGGESSGVDIASTAMQGVSLCQPQESNTERVTVFGGYIMRKSYELGVTCAALFCGDPQFVASDDMTFHRPVSVGDIIRNDARVVYSQPEEGLFQVRVDTSILCADAGPLRSNVFHLTFRPGPRGRVIPSVVPHSYVEAIDYVDGARRLYRPDGC